MTTLGDDAGESDRKIFTRIQERKFDQKYIEAYAYGIVGRTIQIHKHGSELLPNFQLTHTMTDQTKASKRLKTIASLLYIKKNVTRDVLDG